LPANQARENTMGKGLDHWQTAIVDYLIQRKNPWVQKHRQAGLAIGK
jgi:hypothetical protein